MKRTAFQVLGAVVTFGAAGVFAYGTSPVQTTQPALIDQPSNWVAFSAQSERTNEVGEVFSGRYYQARDGSTRAENGSSLNEVSSVIIKNVPRVKFYRWRVGEGWTEQPMQLPPNGWHPRPTWASLFTNTTEMLEGFRLVKRELPNMLVLLAPDLNLFPVIERRMDCTAGVPCGSRLFNIKLGDQPAELFEPPSDAAVTPLSAPGGIIRRPPQ
jgi:hypothetical protein